MKPVSLFQMGTYSMDWVRDFYDQAGIWWGPDTDEPAEDHARTEIVERLCGAGTKRILELGAGAGRTAAAMADVGHTVVAVELSCYTPADFLLLLDGTGLALGRIEVDGQVLDVEADAITTSGPLMEAYSYLVQLIVAGS